MAYRPLLSIPNTKLKFALDPLIPNRSINFHTRSISYTFAQFPGLELEGRLVQAPRIKRKESKFPPFLTSVSSLDTYNKASKNAIPHLGFLVDNYKDQDFQTARLVDVIIRANYPIISPINFPELQDKSPDEINNLLDNLLADYPLVARSYLGLGKNTQPIKKVSIDSSTIIRVLPRGTRYTWDTTLHQEKQDPSNKQGNPNSQNNPNKKPKKNILSSRPFDNRIVASSITAQDNPQTIIDKVEQVAQVAKFLLENNF